MTTAVSGWCDRPWPGRLLDRPQRLEAQPYLVMNGMTVSADGRQVAATREAWQPDIYVGELDSPISALRQVKRITSNLRSDFPIAGTRKASSSTL